MVGTPDVDQALEAPFTLVEVVGDVGREIGVEAIVALHDPVLLVTESGRAEPAGTILQIEMTRLRQSLDAARDQAGGEQRLLGEPDVEVHAGFLEIAAAVGQLLGEDEIMYVLPLLAEQHAGVGDQRVEVRLPLAGGVGVGTQGVRQARRAGGELGQRPLIARAMRCPHLPRHVAHVFALIGIWREGNGRARRSAKFQVAQPGRQRQDVHLPAGVVDVVLAGDAPAGESEQLGETVAVGSATTVSDMQRTGRVGGNELDESFPAATARRTAEARSLLQDAAQHLATGSRRQVEVDEACAGDFTPVDQR
ncbi:MAG: hypothetical protein AW07_01741 [Candidatus Accumulibacter sp. SK-11]|nr:MAG: hypothetical protein AW07_01741 [Candidatus Accumulibacter sp. SK-11]